MCIELNSTITVVQSNSRQVSRNGNNQEGVDFRPFRYTESDYDVIVAIENTNYPDLLISAAEYRFYDDTRNKQYLFERIVAEVNGRAVGFATFGQPWWSFKEGKYFFAVQVLPEWHDTVTPALIDVVFKFLNAHEPTQLVTEVREDQHYVVDRLKTSGFESTLRMPQSELDVQRFDAARFSAACDSVRESGIGIDNLTVVAAEDGDWKRKLWDLEWEILQDVPTPEPLTRMAFDLWQERYLESPNFAMGAQTIARDGDTYVGMSSLWTSEANPKKLYTGLTGVVRSHRRLGIATAMKVNGLLFAQAKGIEVIVTDNEENNPMLDINKQLGFQEKPAFVTYEKRIEFVKPVKEFIKEPL